MGEMDQMVHFYGKILYPSQWGSIWFFLELQGFEVERPSFPLSLPLGHGGPQSDSENWQGGFFLGFKEEGWGGAGVKLSHLLFANNTLIFCNANKEHWSIYDELLCCSRWFQPKGKFGER